jgi:two-component system, sensor histidine kinase
MPTTAPAAPAQSIASRVLADQAHALQGNAAPLMIGSALTTGVAGWTFWSAVSRPALLVWMGVMLVYCALNLYASLKIANRPASLRNAARRLRHSAIACLISGVLWGAGLALMWTPDKFELQLLLIFFGTGLTSAALHALYAHLPAFYGFFVPCVLSIVGCALWYGGIYTTAIVVGVGWYGVANWRFAALMHRTLLDSLQRRYEVAELASDLEAQKDRAEAASLAKSRFLAAASHDLRQPAHALSLFVGALAQQPLQPEGRRLLGHVRASVDAMSNMFNSLLDVSKLDAGMVQPEIRRVALKAMLERICTDEGALAQAKGLTLRHNLRSSTALTDAALLDRILRNLVANAVNYTDQGGVLVTLRSRGGAAVIRVIDTGVGIPADRQEDVFQEFVQLQNPERDRAKGLGLGLAIVRRLTELLQLPLRLKSRPGHGTAFTLTVPQAPLTPAAPNSTPAALEGEVDTPADTTPPVMGDGNLVLVIDDDEDIRVGMRALLAGWGYDVVAAAGLEDLMPILARLPDVPQLIISDYRLRADETGLMVVEHLRDEYNQEIPGILITGDTAPDRLRDALSSGLILLHKPVSPKELLDAMNTAYWQNKDRRLVSR